MIKEKKILSTEEIDFLTDSLLSEEFPKLVESFDQAIYSINDLKISPRDATYWDKQEVLPKIKGPGLRRKYTLEQSMWIKLIQQMRSLGISLSTIKDLKDHLLEPKIDLSQLDPEKVMQILKNYRGKSDYEATLEQLVNDINEEEITFFKSIVLATIVFRKRFSCIVNKDGDYIIYETSEFNELLSTEEEFAEFVSQPYFCLSFAEAYRSLIKEWTPEPFFSESSLLTRTELEILKAIRKGNVKSINIRFKNGEPDLLEIDETNNITIEQRFLDVITKNGYQKITLSTRGGKIVHFENKVLKKLNKSTK